MTTDPRPRRRRGTWIVVALLSALLLVAPVGAEAWAQFARQSSSSTSSDLVDQHPVKAVDVDSGSSEVSISAGTGREVRVHQELSWSLRRPTVDRSWDGDTLRLRTRCDGTLAMTSLGCSVRLDLSVPAGVAVRVVSGSGQVRVSGLTGSMDLRSGSGELQLYGVAGQIRVRTGSGAVDGIALTSKAVDAQTGSGRAKFEFAAPPEKLTGSVGAGEFEATLPLGSRYQVRGGTHSGTWSVEKGVADPAAERRIDVSSRSGTVHIGYPGW
ncbi:MULTISPECIES: DUF4097 family beta strand repeat-containing protein [unclassified Streptomyces]|uniref:DUF4097 family beta strand repeat-containing protein n=1 Tax=unclassified Streptomyces TaxID=2593676 RepID=UPI002E11DCF4|nr:DUF4097 domain-containing protein [Streptomyces sp. NBC_01197]WSS49110.1 DUF4097 domain-containing protein [Streptomyces sp. NBC_01180]